MVRYRQLLSPGDQIVERVEVGRNADDDPADGDQVMTRYFILFSISDVAQLIDVSVRPEQAR